MADGTVLTARFYNLAETPCDAVLIAPAMGVSQVATGSGNWPARNTESLHELYTGATRTMTRIDPQQIGVKRIGHFGFFHRPHADSLWQVNRLPALQRS